MALSRREMLAVSGLGLVGGSLAGAFTGEAEAAGTPKTLPIGGPTHDGYGPLFKAGDELALPRGFSYKTFGHAGSKMSDGLPTPGCHDGQALFHHSPGKVRLIRNHELDLDIPKIKQRSLTHKNAYDRAAPAGCTSSLYDLHSGKLLESFLVLNGTLDNCSGAPTPWGSWLTCEETTDGIKAGYEKPHGYVFEIPAQLEGPRRPGAAQGDGPLRARDRAGRPAHRHRLHDRGQRRSRRRLLPLPAQQEGPPAPWRPAADARDHRRQALQHRHGASGSARCSTCTGSTSTSPTRPMPSISPARCTRRAGPRAAAGFSASRGRPGTAAASPSSPARPATPTTGRSGATSRSTTRPAS